MLNKYARLEITRFPGLVLWETFLEDWSDETQDKHNTKWTVSHTPSVSKLGLLELSKKVSKRENKQSLIIPSWTFKLKPNRPDTINSARIYADGNICESPCNPMWPASGQMQCMMGEELVQDDITYTRGGGVKVSIYHWPPNILRIITSWQEDLVENYQMGFDETLGRDPVHVRWAVWWTFSSL